MPITNGPQIAISQIHAELGGTGQASLNEADIRGLIGKASATSMSMSEWHGASAEVPLSYSHLGTVVGAASPTFSGNVNGGSVTGDDLIVICGGVEGSDNTGTAYQNYTLNGNTAIVHTRTAMSSMDHTSVYVGSREATGGLIGDTSLLVSQTTSYGTFGFRGSCAVFRLVNGARLPLPYAKDTKTTPKGEGSPTYLTMSATPDDIIFVSTYTDFGYPTNIAISTSNNGSVSTWNGVNNNLGSGKFAVITGATNPRITLTNTTGGSSPKCAIGAAVFGYP